ncbi:MAG: bifunctional sugar phosphate isomerase/epimerase/4-hydroxyphenylpyruvate dioxygenase family protein [Boseongicola sp.]
MKTAIATVSISGDFPEKLSAISDANFDGIEIFEQDFIAYDQSPREVGKLVRDYGLDVMLFQPFRDFECLPEPYRSRAFDRAERKFDVMEELGTDLMLICSTVHPKALGGIDRTAADLHELGERAARRNLRVGYEALAWGTHVNDHRDAWEAVRRADHDNIGIIVDSFHTLGRKLSPESIRSIPGDKIFFVQLADAPLIEMDLLYWSRHFRNMPGEGDLDIVSFMRAVAATGYSGPISLEIFNDQFRGGDAHAIAKDGHRSLIALMDDVVMAEPAPALKVPAMPRRANVLDVEFVEFATSVEEAAQLGSFFNALGFQQTGQHINKAVSLWSQGDIRIILNTEPRGYARASFQKRGTSVCDIGLKVDDAAATVTRAQALGLEPFLQSLEENELELPAIRAIGGGVMHFVDEPSGLSRVWDVEFEPMPSDQTASVGLTRIDHIAQSMDYSDMLTWSLFYTSLFDLHKKPVVDVIDPGGIVRSQVIEAPDANLRLTLNGAETDRTVAGQFVANRSGSAVQHIAFETADIFETASKLSASGFASLPMPSNYYDDIAARFGLSASERAKLRKLNILYDEEEGQRFYQLYSQPYAGGFFVEIVEREGGYTGYGAMNAPFRTAALRRHLSKENGSAK